MSPLMESFIQCHVICSTAILANPQEELRPVDENYLLFLEKAGFEIATNIVETYPPP
jgi:hypothetical protein